MVAHAFRGIGITAKATRGEYEKPIPGTRGVWILLAQRVWQRDSRISPGAVVIEQLADSLQMDREHFVQGVGQDGDAILPSFAVPHHDLAVFQIEILDAQPQAFRYPQARAVQQARNDARCAAETAEHPLDFRAG